MVKTDDGYALVRLADNIKDKAVLSYDANKDMIVDSDLIAHRGELEAAAGTVSVGLQEMSSAGEQVIWRNRNTQINYAPPWGVIDETDSGASKEREYAPMQTQERFSIDTDVIENPEFDIHIPQDEVVFRFHMNFPEARDDIVFKITQNDYEMWREIKNVSAGLQTIYLDMPIAFHTGDFVFSIKTYDNLAAPVKVKGNLQTGEVAYKVDIRPFTEKELATKEYVIGAVSGGPADDVMLKSVYDTDNDGKVAWAKWATKVQGINSAGNNYYYGKDSTGVIGFFELPAGADETALKASIKANADDIAKHETAIEGHGTQLATNTKNIATNTKNVGIALTTARSALSDSTTVRNIMPNGIVVDTHHTPHTFTIKLMSKTGIVDTALVDLSSWFSGTTPPGPGITHKLYYGFSQNPPMSEDEILRLSETKTVDKLAGTEIDITRRDSTPNYMYVWIPDTAGTIKGFTFSGFLSAWQSTAVNVAGIDGKFFWSPHKTSAQSVTFEVTV